MDLANKIFSSSVLNRLKLTGHLVNFVSVRGPPLKIVSLEHCGRF